MSSPPKNTAHLAKLVAVQVSSAFRSNTCRNKISTTDAVSRLYQPHPIFNPRPRDVMTVLHSAIQNCRRRSGGCTCEVGRLLMPAETAVQGMSRLFVRGHQPKQCHCHTGRAQQQALCNLASQRCDMGKRCGTMQSLNKLGSPQPGPRHRSEARPNWLPPKRR